MVSRCNGLLYLIRPEFAPGTSIHRGRHKSVYCSADRFGAGWARASRAAARPHAARAPPVHRSRQNSGARSREAWRVRRLCASLGATYATPDARRASALGEWAGEGSGARTPGARVVRGQARRPRPTLQGGLPGTADDEAIFVPIVLSRGRRRYWRLRPADPGSHNRSASTAPPSLSRGTRSFARAAGPGDKHSLGATSGETWLLATRLPTAPRTSATCAGWWRRRLP